MPPPLKPLPAVLPETVELRSVRAAPEATKMPPPLLLAQLPSEPRSLLYPSEFPVAGLAGHTRTARARLHLTRFRISSTTGAIVLADTRNLLLALQMQIH